MPRWTVTTHKDEDKIVVVLRDNGRYLSTDYSKSIRLKSWWPYWSPWLRVQETVSRFEKKAERLNRLEEKRDHDYKGMTRGKA